MSDSTISVNRGELSVLRRAIPFFQKYGLYVFLIILLIVAFSVSPKFFSPRNIQNLLTDGAPLGMAALGQTFVILTAGLDLSVGSLMSTVAVIATSIKPDNAMILPIFLISICFGALVGFVNGWLVTKRKVSPFLATLATMIVLQGIRFAYTKGAPLSGHLPPGFRVLGTGTLFSIPVNLVVLAFLILVFAILLYRSSYGRKLYLVGGNPRAAFLSGIHSDRIIIAAYMICAILASIAGLFLVGYVGSVDNWVGRGYELDSIAAVMMGGASFKGGKGGIFGSIAGVLVLIVIYNLVLLLGFPIQAQLVVKGLVIILAASFYLTRSY
ncbi:MAG: ABC transporter permease [Deltaproteobacteria bacterium]|jgi:ribose/xylose/arabinose/galactoside ABC-type transport system permease subunit|nr:ABC transporter permease [Deltaproteobacteria bacterium]